MLCRKFLLSDRKSWRLIVVSAWSQTKNGTLICDVINKHWSDINYGCSNQFVKKWKLVHLHYIWEKPLSEFCGLFLIQGKYDFTRVLYSCYFIMILILSLKSPRSVLWLLCFRCTHGFICWIIIKILQRSGVVQASATERCP